MLDEQECSATANLSESYAKAIVSRRSPIEGLSGAGRRLRSDNLLPDRKGTLAGD